MKVNTTKYFAIKKISNKAVVLESFGKNCISSGLHQLKAIVNGEIPLYIN